MSRVLYLNSILVLIGPNTVFQIPVSNGIILGSLDPQNGIQILSIFWWSMRCFFINSLIMKNNANSVMINLQEVAGDFCVTTCHGRKKKVGSFDPISSAGSMSITWLKFEGWMKPQHWSYFVSHQLWDGGLICVKLRHSQQRYFQSPHD